MPRRADANQVEIAQGLRCVGALVFDTHSLGRGFPDLAIWFRRRWTLLECKRPKAKLTRAEERWHLVFDGAAHVVHNLDEALTAIGLEVER